MSDKPILFSAPMIKALLAGNKTQTRRILCPFDATPEGDGGSPPPYVAPYEDGACIVWEDIEDGSVSKWPRSFAVGDCLYVRETWKACSHMDGIRPGKMSRGEPVHYVADGMVRELGCMMIKPGKTRVSIHMPRWASRLTLIVTDVRVQRLLDINEEDAKAEGAVAIRADDAPSEIFHFRSHIWRFQQIWEAIHGAGTWFENPWVAAYTFSVHHRNIDQMGSVK